MDEWILRLIGMIITVLSPELKTGLTEFVAKLEADAKKTPNPWDDIFVGLLKTLFGIK